MNKKKILVTGATGMLGTCLVPILCQQGHSVITHGRKSQAEFSADLTNATSVNSLITEVVPDTIVNLIGLTSVEVCEQDINTAYLVNTKTVENIVRVLRDCNINAHLIHISTDHIYDSVGFNVEENVTISNNYGMTKYAGELAACKVNSSVLRTNFIGRSGVKERQSLTDWVFCKLKEDNSMKVFTDVLFSPLSMKSLSTMVALVAEKEPVGVFNLGSNGGMSKADMAFAFAKALGLSTKKMSRIKSTEAETWQVCRPKNMRMDSSKFESVLEIKLPSLEEEINCIAIEYAFQA